MKPATTRRAPPDPLALWRAHGAYLQGHFQLSSGLHSDTYFQAAQLLKFPWLAARLCRQLAKRFADARIDAVLGPALGGIIVSHEVARALRVPALFAERPEKTFVLRRGFELAPGARVLVVEDVVTTGVSFLEVARLAEGLGAVVAGVGCLVYRGPDAEGLPYPFASLVRLRPTTWSAEECPLCRRGEPVTKPGSRPGGQAKR